MKLLPFGGLEVMSTTTDEEFIEVLLDKTGKKTLNCGACGSTSFKVDALVKMNLDISIGRPDPRILIRENKPEAAMLLNVLKCATCGAGITDFYIEVNSNENNKEL